MEVDVPDNALRKVLEDDRKRVRAFGKDIASKLAIRLAALLAAERLSDFWPPFKLPERCHELKGELKGTFSIDLKHPFRLLFRPVEERPTDPMSMDKERDELERWSSITHVDIVAVKDTHD
ncbi:MAG: type II toxin-antitoxin system RelE/ParE family toxin [Acidobacteria bacterium]|nr:type II toxin-antitoxin system RelE/ParE family toxin [Acidobacteriota bacterium]